MDKAEAQLSVEQNLQRSAKETLQSLERHVARAKEMLTKEQEKAASLLTSPEWSTWSERECARALTEQEKRIKHAKKNLAQVELARKRLQKR
jgi:AAA+ ATPase superfamily predicted ATPase